MCTLDYTSPEVTYSGDRVLPNECCLQPWTRRPGWGLTYFQKVVGCYGKRVALDGEHGLVNPGVFCVGGESPRAPRPEQQL